MLCPNCDSKRLRKQGEQKTDWYGKLTFYRCSDCGERWVRTNDGELEEAI